MDASGRQCREVLASRGLPVWAVRPVWAAVAGVLLLVSFPRVDWWWSAPLGVAALLVAVAGLTPLRAWVTASFAYVVLFLPLLEWVRFLGVGPWLLLAVLQAAIAGLLGPLAAFVDRVAGSRALVRVVGLAAAAVAIEGLRSRVPFGGFTWGRLAFAQSGGPLLPWAAVGGAPMLGAAVAVVAAGIVHLIGSRSWPGAARSVLLIAAPFALAAAIPMPVEGSTLSVAVVQGNVPRGGLDAFAEDLLVLDNHLAQTRRLAAEVAAGVRPTPDLVIWPENAADQDPRSEPETRARVDAAVRSVGQPLLLGAVLRDGAWTSNALVVWGDRGVEGSVYRKRHLVPFGEYMPLRGLVERVYPAADQLLPRDFTPGRRVGRVDLRGVPLAVATCFEVAFDDIARSAVAAGGQLLVLPSNNASYGRSAQSAQQLAMARLRAVEHGRSTVVATTSGISALIRPDGRVVARSGLFEPALLQAGLPRRTALTLATRWGRHIEMALAGLLLIPLLGGAMACRRRERVAVAGPAGSQAPAPEQPRHPGATGPVDDEMADR